MKCTKCGTENVADARFCKSCGEALDVEPLELKDRIEPSGELTVISDKIAATDFIIKNRFRVIRKLGRGGMGEVLLAEDVKLKRNVAVKSILTQALSDTSTKARFLREAQTASQLDHPNICTIYEIYEEDDHDFIVMQYVDGVTLDQIIKVKPLSISKFLEITLQVCNGMIEANAREIIHRDIKPGNIMVDKKGVVKILDFGLAKFGGETASMHTELNLTQKGVVLGTVAYLSPEQASGKEVDLRSDIFSFGILLFEMLEGKNPFKEEEQIATLYNVLNKEAVFEKDIPQELKDIVLKCLEKDKKNRYTSFYQLKNDLEQFRLKFSGMKEKAAEEDGTEILDYTGHEALMKEVQKTSDNEGLGDLVYRIKKSKASTQRLTYTKRLRTKYLLIPAIIILLGIAAFIFLPRESGPTWFAEKADETFYIYLHNFENKTGEDALAGMVNYLLMESLNQFDQFKLIDEETAKFIAAKGSEIKGAPNEKAGNQGEEIDLLLLRSKFNVKYELSGEISKDGRIYMIHAALQPIDEKDKPFKVKPFSISSTGESRDSLLRTQVDLLARRVYIRYFPEREKDLEIKKVSGIFGSEWDKFSNYYAGLSFFRKTLYDKARPYFLKARDLLISKYYIAKMEDFDGDRNESIRYIKEILAEADSLTPALRLKVQALDTRLKFDFNAAILNLEKLTTQFPFSKEAFYELGEAYFRHANPEQAIKYYELALDLDKSYSDAINHLGYCYSYIGEHNKAIELFEEYRDLDRTANSFDSLGDGYFYKGYLDDAENMKISALAGDAIAYPYQSLADIYILKARFGDADDALKRYLRMISTNQAKAYVLTKQGFIQYLLHNYEDALKLLDESLQIFDPDDINEKNEESHWLKGMVLLKLDRVEESKVQLEWLRSFVKKYRLDRDNFDAVVKYFIHLEALTAEKENNLQRAEELFRLLVDMKTRLSFWITYYNYQFFHTEYARFLSRNKRYREALSEIEKCLEFNNDRYIPALWLKADLLEELKEGNPKDIYHKIGEFYGESTEKNYYRELLKKRLE